MEKISNKFNNKKEDRRKFIKNLSKHILTGSIIGSTSYYIAKKTPEQIKKIKESLEKEEKEFNNFIDFIENLYLQLEKENKDYEKYYQNFVEEIENVILQEKEINIFDKKQYIKLLFRYDNKIQSELNRINIRKKRTDSILNSIIRIQKSKNITKHKKVIEITNNLIKTKTRLLEIEKKYLELQKEILSLIEKIDDQTKPNKKLA